MFMSPLVGQNHHEAGQLLIRQKMEERVVPLVINNHFIIQSALESEPDDFLMPEDLSALRENYLHFWGPFWLAGYDFPKGSPEQEIDLMVPATYTLQGEPISIDGAPVEPGNNVTLSRGTHVVVPAEGSSSRLIWGENLRPPAYAPPPSPISSSSDCGRYGLDQPTSPFAFSTSSRHSGSSP